MVRENEIRLYVVGWRVNLLLALLPSALQIDPPFASKIFAFRISRTKPSQLTVKKISKIPQKNFR
jgi:hypothetical protein